MEWIGYLQSVMMNILTHLARYGHLHMVFVSSPQMFLLGAVRCTMCKHMSANQDMLPCSFSGVIH